MEVEAESIKEKNLKEFQDLLNKDMEKRVLKEGSIIEARITEITQKFVQLDANAKSDSLVASSEFENLASLKVGDTVQCLIERIESFKTGQLVLSRSKAILLQNWKKILEAYKHETIVTGVVKSRIRGGYLAVVMGTNCFLPGSAISDHPIKPDEVQKLFNVGKKMRVVSVNETRFNAIVSIKEVHMKDKEKQMQEILKKIKVGDVLTKTDGFELSCSALNDWAAWILISTEGASAIGMMHITAMSWSRLKKPSDILSLGQKIPKIKVIDIDKTTNPQRISLSLKDLPGVKNPFDGLKERYLVNKFYSGKIVKILKFGAFVQLEDSIQALLHQSECDPFNRMANINDLVQLGKEVNVRLLKVDEKEKKISVSLVPESHPWDNFLKKFSENQIVSCEVAKRDVRHLHLNIENSGIPSRLCLCFWKNLSYNSESEENLKNFSVKEKVKAKILNIDSKKMRVFLGVREASSDSDPFEYFSQKETGSTVVCVVREVMLTGIKVSPENQKNKLLITIKKNHLAKSLSDCRPEIYRKNDIVKSQIIALDKKQRKVQLSIKALEESEEAKLVKKFGKDGSSSGKVLKDILGKVFSSKKDKKDKK
jgi:small subunit ribosomal protein S1